jgi:hypothetical protein
MSKTTAALLWTVWVIVAAPAAAQVELRGFVESATGVATADRMEGLGEFTLRETRLQLKGDVYGDLGESHFVVDFLADQVTDRSDLALREGYLKFNTFSDHLEVRAGRQPTTWGTGDLLFINDLFPKDYVSFFVGREDQYLKGPSDALRLGVYGLPFHLDFVYTPQFTPDVIPTGERLEFWAPAMVEPVRPEQELGNGEFALRAHRNVGNWNWAAYGYVGFWKTPQGALAGPEGIEAFFHPELHVWGASVRGPLFGGVSWAEGGYYDSREEDDGSNVFVPNSEIRGMVGYERQWWSDFTGGLQFYWETMQDHDVAALARQQAIDQAVAGGGDRSELEQQFYLKDETRTLFTLRLMQLLRQQTVNASFFAFYSPSDEDSYVRLSLAYDYSDQIRLTVGANLFVGDDERTLFGMNQDNDNAYARLRLTF